MPKSKYSKVAAAACLLAPFCVAQAGYVVTRFDVPGATSTDVWDISDTGQLVGTAYGTDSAYGYVYGAGSYLRLNGPTGSSAAYATGISNAGAVVGSWLDSTTLIPTTTYVWDPVTGTQVPVTTNEPLQRGYIYEHGTYTTINVPFAGNTSSATLIRAISPDGRYVSGTYDGGGFVLDRVTSAVTEIPRLANVGFVVAQGINSAGQLVGSDGNRSYVRDLNTGDVTYLGFAGVYSVRARAINDHGLIAGYFSDPDGTVAWVGTTSGYQTINGLGAFPSAEGINNLGQVSGYFDNPDGTTHGFIATPIIDPISSAAGAFTFSTAVVADVPIFIDPLVAIGYDYKIGAGNPLFKTVSLPIGIGDGKFVITVGGQSFAVLANEIFDFTAHGFASGVAEFTVTGIEPAIGLDPSDPTAFVTRLTFAGNGMFTGSQTALTASVPEPSTWALMSAGCAGLMWMRRRRHPVSNPA